LPDQLAKIEDLFLLEKKKRVVVYEHCGGKNLLEDVLTNEMGRLAEDRTKKIIYQILTGLRYLHSKNIFHGHITPQCIVYSDYDKAAIKITGFGYHTLLSKDLSDGYEKYFHPADSFANGEFYGPLTDIWSVGCLMYFMLSGKGLTGLG
jgi:serine/threonine protein kinase